MPIRIERSELRRLARFVLVGTINTAFSFAVYALLLLLGLHYALAVLIANIAGIAFNFKTIGRFVFRRTDSRPIFRFVAVYGLMYGLGVLCIKVLLSWGLDRFLAGAAAAVPMAGISFVLLSVFVFQTGKNRAARGTSREAA